LSNRVSKFFPVGTRNGSKQTTEVSAHTLVVAGPLRGNERHIVYSDIYDGTHLFSGSMYFNRLKAAF
jgi:hypothetical protein